MPKGPKGQKRPADVVGAAVMVAKIATGEIEDEVDAGKLYEIAKFLSVPIEAFFDDTESAPDSDYRKRNMAIAG